MLMSVTQAGLSMSERKSSGCMVSSATWKTGPDRIRSKSSRRRASVIGLAVCCCDGDDCMTRPRVVGNEGERGSDAGWWWWWRSLVGRWQKAEEKDEGEQVNVWLVKAVAEESGADGDTKAVVAAGAVVRAQPRVKDDDDDDDNIFLFMANVVCFFLFLLFEVVVVEQDDSSTRGSVTIMPTSNEIFFSFFVESRCVRRSTQRRQRLEGMRQNVQK